MLTMMIKMVIKCTLTIEYIFYLTVLLYKNGYFIKIK